jgi:nucleotide-binding universal stress UspA family protein
MLRTILVPLDGSELAEEALECATALSTPTAARLVLVRVEIAHSLADIPDVQARSAAVHRAEQYLAQVESRLAARGFTVGSEVRSAGRAADGTVEVAVAHAVDMIVMTSHVRTGPSHLLLGSVAEGIVAHSRVPVLVKRAGQIVHPDLLIEGTPRLLVPVDGTAHAEAALEVATALASDLNGELVLLEVEVRDDVQDAERDVQVYLDAEVPDGGYDAYDYISRLQERLNTPTPKLPIFCEVRRGRPEDQIVKTATELDATLIVMATHGRTGVDRLIAGSVAGRVIEHADQPVVLIRPTLAQVRAVR